MPYIQDDNKFVSNQEYQTSAKNAVGHLTSFGDFEKETGGLFDRKKSHAQASTFEELKMQRSGKSSQNKMSQLQNINLVDFNMDEELRLQ